MCWVESILDDRKANVMCLYCLCLLTDVHAWIHLQNGKISTTLADDSIDHKVAMERCTIHLAYLGCGLHVELQPQKLLICTETEQCSDIELDTKPVIIGELTAKENSTLDKLIKFGLGFALDRRCEAQLKEEVPSTSVTSNSIAVRDCVVKLVRTGTCIILRSTNHYCHA